jgi:hypothetical protein
MNEKRRNQFVKTGMKKMEKRAKNEKKKKVRCDIL